MADRENIINHFQDAIAASGSNNKWRFVRVDVLEDAIKLLKEQEPVKPRFVDGKRNHFVKCGSCNFDLMHGMNFCPHCGQAVKWDD